MEFLPDPNNDRPMKDLPPFVNKAVEELVISNFGEDKWELIKTKAGVDVDVFISNESYPDAMTYDLVGTASEVLGAPADDILIAFGEHWVLKTAAKSYGPIRVNAVAPGLVATPWTKDWEAMHAGVAATAPVPRSATPDDCAEAVLALLRNKYTSGEIFVVDGGLTQLL